MPFIVPSHLLSAWDDRPTLPSAPNTFLPDMKIDLFLNAYRGGLTRRIEAIAFSPGRSIGLKYSLVLRLGDMPEMNYAYGREARRQYPAHEGTVEFFLKVLEAGK